MTRALTVLAAASLAAAAPARAAGPRPRIAIMELRAGQGLDPRAAGTLTTVLTADAARVGFDVISQSDIAAMLAFQKQRQMLGCTDDGCLAELGGALGADFVLSGEAAVVGTRNHVSLVIVDAKKAKVLGRNAGFSDAGEEQLALATLARFRALVRVVRPDLAAGAPAIESPSAAKLHTRRTISWWTMGAGAAVLAGGGVFGLRAHRQANDLEGAWQKPDYAKRFDDQRRTAKVADVLMGAGLVTAGVGAVLYFTSSPPVVAIPVADASGAGLVVAGRF